MVSQEKFLHGLLLGLGLLCIIYLIYRWYNALREGFDTSNIILNKKLVPYNYSTKCMPSIVDSRENKIWYCDSNNDAKKLIMGPKAGETWLSQFDQVCVAQDKTDNPVYICIDFTYYPDYDGLSSLKGDYEDTCYSLKDAYDKINKNVDSLAKMRDTIKDEYKTSTGSQLDYKYMMDNFKCATKTSGGDKAACDAMKIGIDKMNAEGIMMGNLFNTVQTPVRGVQQQRKIAHSEAGGFLCREKVPTDPNATAIDDIIDIKNIGLQVLYSPSPASLPANLFNEFK